VHGIQPTIYRKRLNHQALEKLGDVFLADSGESTSGVPWSCGD